MKTIGILGGTGYTGSELLRILSGHDGVRVEWVTSEKFAGMRIDEVFPALSGFYDIKCVSASALGGLPHVDLAFSCLPHGTSMHFAGKLLQSGSRVVDFSADFRFRSAALYEELYKAKHRYASYLETAVYGIPEIFRADIAAAGLVANPGCFATGVILGTLPLLSAGVIDAASVIADSKSGESGGGRAPSLAHHFPEANENAHVNSAAAAHQGPEMAEVLSSLTGGNVGVTFIPHNIPVDRGILTTIYCRLKADTDLESVLGLFREFYKDERFVRVYEKGTFPTLKDTKYTNVCAIGLDVRDGLLISVVSLDNLFKGASGQAVQNMNIMLGFPEAKALDGPGMYP